MKIVTALHINTVQTIIKTFMNEYYFIFKQEILKRMKPISSLLLEVQGLISALGPGEMDLNRLC